MTEIQTNSKEALLKEAIKEQEYKAVQESRKEILGLLDKNYMNLQYLDLGETEKEWYFGFKIQEREAILTSSGKILRNTEIKTKEGNIGKNEIKDLFSYDGYLGEIAPIISNETIKSYFSGSTLEN